VPGTRYTPIHKGPRPKLDPRSAVAQRAANLPARLAGVQTALVAAAARGDEAAVERLSRLAAALSDCICMGTPFYGGRHSKPEAEL
jgi:hypothetical protein